MSKTIKFAAYGTLREGNYNYDRFKGMYGKDFQYETTITSEDKFVMLTNGMYPLLMREKKNCTPTTIVFDIIKCSEECYRDICAMEFGAGYEEDFVELNGEKYNIFIFNHETNYKQIKTGDWNNQAEVKNGLYERVTDFYKDIDKEHHQIRASASSGEIGKRIKLKNTASKTSRTKLKYFDEESHYSNEIPVPGTGGSDFSIVFNSDGTARSIKED